MCRRLMGTAGTRRMHSECYIRLCAFDSTHSWESLRISFIVQRSPAEPGFMLARHENGGRNFGYETQAYVMEKPEEKRYSYERSAF